MIKTTLIDCMGSDLSVVNAARVSFGKKSDWERDFSDIWDNETDTVTRVDYQHLSERDDKLINYLANHKHLSPFGHAFASFHVKAPIFVARQLVKHKFLRWNEISRRYVDEEPEFYYPETWRGRSDDKKQGSSEEVITEILVEGWKEEYPQHLKETMKIFDAYDSVMHESALCLYNDMLYAGVAPEQARMVLPQSMMTEWYWSGSLDAFADMCHLRCKSDTQLETQIVANYIDDKMQDLFPVSWEALRMYAE